MLSTVIIRMLGTQPYLPCWQAMQQFTQIRSEETSDEIWVLEHPPVFTQGQNGKSEHILEQGDIPIIQVDRGGQVTYHGPGQLVVYPLINLKKLNLNVRDMVSLLEQSVIQMLKDYQIDAYAKLKAPGIYIEEQKIGSIGLRIRRGCSYHGLALNINMDLSPFEKINPCGFSNLKMTQLSNFQPNIENKQISEKLLNYLTERLGYNQKIIKEISYADENTFQ